MRRPLFALFCLAPVACSSSSEEPAQLGGDTGSEVADAVTEAATDTGAETAPIFPDVGPTSKFTTGHVFLAGSRNAEVFEFDETLTLVTRWTDPHFGKVLPFPGQALDLGPAGMAFDASGNLVVAGVDSFCVFSAPNVLVDCHPKIKKQATENVIFDHLGNLYTTTATGGTNEIHKYDSSYAFVKTFAMPTGEMTGVTCDPTGNLFIGSQLGSGKSQVFKVDRTTLTPTATIPLAGTVEGLQYAAGDVFWAALQGSIVKVSALPPYTITTTIKDPGLAYAVPLTIDGAGNVYTSDYENGSGTAAADIYVWKPDGTLKVSRKATEVWGPFGLVVGGTRLPCGAFRPL